MGQRTCDSNGIMPSFTCPTCTRTIVVNRKEDAPDRPFCCERCKLLDLAKWFNEEYRIETPSWPSQTDTPSDHPGE